MKNTSIIYLLSFFLISCGQGKPIVIINKRVSLRTRILAGEVYFSTVYTLNNGRIVEQQDMFKEWEVGDTIGYGNKIDVESIRAK